MDQAKWSIPRNRHVRSTKAEMPLQKPRFKIQGVWRLGWDMMRLLPGNFGCFSCGAHCHENCFKSTAVLRISNIVLFLWVVSPKCAGDASMVLETTLRSIDLALDMLTARGAPQPQEILWWVP